MLVFARGKHVGYYLLSLSSQPHNILEVLTYMGFCTPKAHNNGLEKKISSDQVGHGRTPEAARE